MDVNWNAFIRCPGNLLHRVERGEIRGRMQSWLTTLLERSSNSTLKYFTYVSLSCFYHADPFSYDTFKLRRPRRCLCAQLIIPAATPSNISLNLPQSKRESRMSPFINMEPLNRPEIGIRVRIGSIILLTTFCQLCHFGWLNQFPILNLLW